MTDPKPPDVSNLELLSEARIANNVARHKLGNVAVLQKMADRIARDELKYPASAVLIVTLGPDGPNVTWHGIESIDQLQEADSAISAVRSAYMYGIGGKPIDPSEVAREDAERRVRGQRASEAYAQRKRAEKPWRCEHCDRGFKTERGARQHENLMERKGCPKCKRPWCVMSGRAFDPKTRQLIYCQKCEWTGQPRYVKPSEVAQLSSPSDGLKIVEGDA